MSKLSHVFRNEKKHFLLVTVILLINVGLHVVSIGYPAAPVFDEAHFASYAASYASGRAFYDIHPPLGKLIFALPLTFGADESAYSNAQFIFSEKDTDGTGVHLRTEQTYKSFPFVSLRLVSVFFGVALALVAYLFTRFLTRSPNAALWMLTFVTFENTILLQSRLILLDPIYITFGLLALFLFLSRRVHPALAGLVWGLALSVKLIAVVFIVPLILYEILIREKKARVLNRVTQFGISGTLTVFLFLAIINPLFFSLESRVSAYTRIAPQFDAEQFFDAAGEDDPLLQTPVARHLLFSVIETTSMISGNLLGDIKHPSASKWYTWPIMQTTIPYFYGNDVPGALRTISLKGNPFLWILALAAVVFGLITVFKRRVFTGNPKILAVLVGGYIGSLLPFLAVERIAFLYHYLPALLFGFSALAYIVATLQAQSTFHRRVFGIAFLATTIIGFVIAAPYTYGLPVPIQ